MATKGPRQRAAAWLRERVAEAGEIDSAALVERGLAHFKQDAGFLADWAEDTLRPVLYTLLLQVIADTRTPVLPREEQPGDAPAERPDRWARWLDRLEHSGGRYLRLRAMTRADVLAWGEERRERGLAELHLAALAARLAAGMDDTQTVEEVYGDEQIAALAAGFAVTYRAVAKEPGPVRNVKRPAGSAPGTLTIARRGRRAAAPPTSKEAAD